MSAWIEKELLNSKLNFFCGLNIAAGLIHQG